MRSLFTVPAALVIAATSASAQPVIDINVPATSTTYLCTPGSQVLAVPPAGAPTLIRFKSGSSTINTVPGADPAGLTECVLGPDGLLYAANGFKVIRFTPAAVVQSVQTVVSNLPAASRGLAFNLATLYITLANDTRVAVPNATGSFGGNGLNGNSLTPVSAGSGGPVFDITGNMVTTSVGAVRTYAPPYTGNAISENTSVLLPRGVAVDTCGDVLVADKASQSIKRLSNGSVAVQFDKKDFPVALENDGGNRLHILTAEDDAGTNAKYWVATAPFKTSNCGSLTTGGTPRVVLKDLTTGPNPLLLSSRGLGLAAGDVEVTITQPLSTSDCAQDFHFGYHLIQFSYQDCSNLPEGSSLSITAVKSRYADVKFDGAIDPQGQMKGMRYSPLGGHVIQYLFVPSAPLANMQNRPEFLAKFGFFTQEAVQEPGIARHPSDDPAALFNQIVGVEYWDVGSLDAAGGTRERDFSKRVVFNKTQAFQDCAIPDLLDSPMDHQNPLFNGPQNIKVSFTAIGRRCNNASIRLSIVRIFSDHYDVQTVLSTDGRPLGEENKFKANKNAYSFNLDLSKLDTTGASAESPAQFMITIWGQLAPPKNFFFQVTKPQ